MTGRPPYISGEVPVHRSLREPTSDSSMAVSVSITGLNQELDVSTIRKLLAEYDGGSSPELKQVREFMLNIDNVDRLIENLQVEMDTRKKELESLKKWYNFLWDLKEVKDK